MLFRSADRTKAPAGQTGTPADVQSRLELGFRLLDVNRDGKIDRKEFNRITEIAPRLKHNSDGADYLFGVLQLHLGQRVKSPRFT